VDFSNPLIHLKAFVPWERQENGVLLHHIPRLTLHRSSWIWKVNQRILSEAVRKLVKEWGIEIVVFSQSAYLIGYPPTDTGAMLVFDYVDYSNERILREYVSRAERILCASRALQRQVVGLGSEAAYVPNGVSYARLRKADGRRVRTRYGLDAKTVISLIGLTCSPDLYFVRSLVNIHKSMPDVRFLFVGKGPQYRPLRRACKRIEDCSVWTGWVPQDEIYDYFLASDVGMYPGADNVYFRSACPIKILEYAAAGKTVVSSPVDEIHALGLRNVIEVDANSDSFYGGLLSACSRRTNACVDTVPSWPVVAARFESVLRARHDGLHLDGFRMR